MSRDEQHGCNETAEGIIHEFDQQGNRSCRPECSGSLCAKNEFGARALFFSRIGMHMPHLILAPYFGSSGGGVT